MTALVERLCELSDSEGRWRISAEEVVKLLAVEQVRFWRALHGVLLSMAARTGLPLLLALALVLERGALFRAGGVYYLLVFYFAALAVETPLSLPRTETNPPRPEGTPRSVQTAAGCNAGLPSRNPRDAIS